MFEILFGSAIFPSSGIEFLNFFQIIQEREGARNSIEIIFEGTFFKKIQILDKRNKMGEKRFEF